jgi:hypothetical protein
VPLDTVVQALYSAGFRGDDLVKMAGIGYRESGGYNRFAHNPVPPDDSYGLFQINMLGKLASGREDTIQKITGSRAHEELYDPFVNAQLAYSLYKGSGLSPWGIKHDGVVDPLYKVPQDALDRAKTEAQKLYPQGYGDVAGPGGFGGPGRNVNVSSSPVSFNNTFHVQVATTGSGTDIDALVRQISYKLDSQMRRLQTTRR